jgi:hypothetical protein
MSAKRQGSKVGFARARVGLIVLWGILPVILPAPAGGYQQNLPSPISGTKRTTQPVTAAATLSHYPLATQWSNCYSCPNYCSSCSARCRSPFPCRRPLPCLPAHHSFLLHWNRRHWLRPFRCYPRQPRRPSLLPLNRPLHHHPRRHRPRRRPPAHKHLPRRPTDRAPVRTPKSSSLRVSLQPPWNTVKCVAQDSCRNARSQASASCMPRKRLFQGR